jgi:release factor glutamine methyltransferase
MTIEKALMESGIERADAEALLAFAIKKDRTWLVAHGLEELDEAVHARYQSMVQRRAESEPVAYITGEKEFFGRSFIVDSSTLIPRPATEHLVEQALRVLNGEKVERTRDIDAGIVAWTDVFGDISGVKTVVDVGTGSGCIAITIACERPDMRVIATDIFEEALNITKRNAHRHKVWNRIELRKLAGLISPMEIDRPFLLVSNPPYIPSDIQLESDVSDFEPHAALFAGKRGMDVIGPLVEAARNHPFCAGFVIECRKEQAL